MTYKSISRLITAACLLAGQYAFACTAFVVDQAPEIIMGKSFDWRVNDGIAVVNPRGLEKTALARAGYAPARWRSQFGSVTFNQHGREFPISGINETGLAVEVLWLNGSAFPAPDRRPEVNELQFVQYLLDNYSTVDEIASNVDRVRVARWFASVHYFACDRTGECASIDFLSGKAAIHHHAGALANDPFDAESDYRSRFTGFGGNAPIPQDPSSLSRFVRASYLARQFLPKKDGDPAAYGFEMLKSVRTVQSQWNIVYSLRSRRVQFKLAGAESPMSLDLSRLDFSCSKPAKTMMLTDAVSGDVSGRLTDYSRASNQNILERGLRGAGIAAPAELVEAIAKYPDTLSCSSWRSVLRRFPLDSESGFTWPN